MLLQKNVVSTKSVDRLALLISQECPLNCIYCYANGGTYEEGGLMDITVLERAINVFYRVYGTIRTIQLFGGEPLLNIKAIRRVIELLKEKVEKEEIASLPKISLETGLGVSKNKVEELVQLLEDNSLFEFEIVVSFDGPAKIQNLQRPFKNGNPSYEMVVENLNILKIVNQPKAIETTYTRKHSELGITHQYLKDFFTDKFGIKNVLIRPVMSKCRELLVESDQNLEDLKIVVESSLESDDKVKEYLGILLNSDPTEYYCGAGISSFAVSTSGYIYPCQLVVGDKRFAFGNIKNSFEEIVQKLKEMENRYRVLNSKANDELCKKCFLEYFCEGCVFKLYYLGESIDAAIPHDYCKQTKELVTQLFNKAIY